MTIYLILIEVILLLFCLFFVKRKTLYSPWSITLLVWTLEITLYLSLDHGLYATKGFFELALICWLVPFVLSSYFICSILRGKKTIEPIMSNYNPIVFKGMFILTVIFVPISAYLTYQYASTLGLSNNIFFNLRYTANQGDYDSGILKYISFIALVPLLAQCNAPIINKSRLALIFILNIILSLTTMAKTSLFIAIVGSILILIWNNRIKPRVLIIVFALFLGLTILFSVIRSNTMDYNNADFSQTLSVYTLSPLVAFDQEASMTSDYNYQGIKTLRFFYQLTKSLGFDVEVDNTVQPFVKVPYSTNVYTVFYQYFKDFGYLGIVLFAIIDGFIYGYIYSRINQNPVFKIIYAYCAVSLFLQFFNEIFWVTASIVIQICILSYLIYYHYGKFKNNNNLHLV